MDKEHYLIINTLREHYKKGGNILEYLRKHFNKDGNSFDDILLSYDLQAGSYVQYVKDNPEYVEKYTSEIFHVFSQLGKFSTILEAGVGEATTFSNVLKRFPANSLHGYGIDISWSRIKYGQQYQRALGLNNCFLSTGNIFSLPFASNSIDVVYSYHALEPNGGKEKALLSEVYRVARNYVVLFEPAYDLANADAKAMMKKQGYCIGLWDEIKQAGYEVIEHRMMNNYNNPLNPTGLTIIKKKESAPSVSGGVLACPITLTNLELKDGCYFSKGASIIYPVMQGVPCLLPENAVMATHFEN